MSKKQINNSSKDRVSAFGYQHPQQSPGFLLYQTTIIWQRLIKSALKPYQIPHAQFVVLATTKWVTETQQLLKQSNIVMLSKLDKMTVSTALKGLIAKQLITFQLNLSIDG